MAQAEPTADVGGLVQPDLSLRLGEEWPFVGGGVFEPQGQSQSKAATIYFGDKQSFVLKIANANETAEPLQLQGLGSSKGWKVQYFDSESGKGEITEQVTGTGWNTPPLAAGNSHLVRVEVTPTAEARADQDFLVMLGARGQIRDGVRVQGVLPQFIQKLQYRDKGNNWVDIPDTGVVEMRPYQTISFRAVKGKPDLDWPTKPERKPLWTNVAQNNQQISGEQATFHFTELTTEDNLNVVRADCANVVSVKVRVRVEVLFKMDIWSYGDELFTASGTRQGDTTRVTALVSDWQGKPQQGIKVRFTRIGGSGEINGPGTADDEAISRKGGYATVHFTAGNAPGTARIVASIVHPPEAAPGKETAEVVFRLK